MMRIQEMTVMKAIKMANLIHVAEIDTRGGTHYLFLRKESPDRYIWFEVDKDGKEKATSLTGGNTEEAIKIARKQWQNQSFRTLKCGFRFTLPERDEHGNNALFNQMSLSLGSFNGIYYDEDLGHNCIVNQVPLRSRLLWEKLKTESKL